MILPLYLKLMKHHLENSDKFRVSHFKNKLGRVQERATKVIRGLQNMTFEESLEELRLLHLVKRGLRGI